MRLPWLLHAIRRRRYIAYTVVYADGLLTGAAASGGVAEWLKAHAWKACRRETVSRVRIPLPPPIISMNLLLLLNKKYFRISGTTVSLTL